MNTGFVRILMAASASFLLAACGSDNNSGSNQNTTPTISLPPVAFAAGESSGNCPNSGEKVVSFSDTNRNGKQDNNEKGTDTYYCAGTLAFQQDYSSPIQVSEAPKKLEPLEERNLTLTFTLSERPLDTLSFDYETTEGTATSGDDFVAKTGSVVFQRGETSKSINITIKHDTIQEVHETLTLKISNQVNTDLTDITIRINDDEGIKVSFTEAQSVLLESSTNTNTRTLVLKLSEALASDIQVPFLLSPNKVAEQFGVPENGKDFTVVVPDGRFPLGDNEKCNADDELEPLSALKGCLSFKAGQTEQTIEVTAIDDDLDESRERVAIQLHLVDTLSSGDNTGHILSIADAADSIKANFKHTCALSEDKTLKCWGRNTHAQLGFVSFLPVGAFANSFKGNTPDVQFVFDTKLDETGNPAPNPKVIDFSLGFLHTCALFDNGQVKCWGYNGSGQLGDGTTKTLLDFSTEISSVKLDSKAESISLGVSHSCALLIGDKVKCWGEGRLGQLGLNNTSSVTGETKEQLIAIDFSKIENGIKQLDSGAYHNCVLFNSGKVACWGENKYGQLGIGDNLDANQVIGDQAEEVGSNIQFVDLGDKKTAQAIALGDRHSCALLDDNTVKCWGDNTFGQLGQGNTTTIGDKQNQMGDALTPIDFGSNFDVKKIVVGGFHSCVVGIVDKVTSENKIKCWGRNRSGQLGYEDTNNRGDQAQEMGADLVTLSFPEGRFPQSIGLGQNHSCAVLDTDEVKCWGLADNGQLGLNNTESMSDGLAINPAYDANAKVEEDHPDGDCQPANRLVPISCEGVSPELANPDLMTEVF